MLVRGKKAQPELDIFPTYEATVTPFDKKTVVPIGSNASQVSIFNPPDHIGTALLQEGCRGLQWPDCTLSLLMLVADRQVTQSIAIQLLLPTVEPTV